MSSKKRHIKTNDADAFQRYLNNEMPPSEAHQFERQLLNDAFEQDALEGLASIDSGSINHDLEHIKAKLGTKTKPLWRRPAMYAAASLALTIGIVSTLWWIVPDEPATVSESRMEPSVSEQIPKQTEYKQSAIPEVAKEKKSLDELPQQKKLAQAPSPSVSKAEANKETPIQQEAKQIQTINDFTLADAENVEVETPKRMGREEKVENEAFSVDFGTIEGTKIEGYTSSSKDSNLKIVRGRVMDRNNKPLPGANIHIKGTQLGTVADMDGHYEMTIPAQDSSKPLLANFIGFVPQESTGNADDSINFMLEEELIALSEVVTTGYSEEEKRRITEFIDAEPQGGMEKYITDIEKSLRYPKSGSGKKEQVVVLVTIDLKGDISNIDIKRSPGEDYSIEVIRAIRKGADWIPASNKGFPVDDTIKLKLRFIPD